MRLAVRTTTHTIKAFSRQGQVRSRSTSRARSSNASAAVAYFGVGGALALYTLDEKLDLRQWKHVSHAIDGSSSVSIRSRVRAGNGEAGQGCVDWPAGRVLLQWALDGGLPLRGAAILEIGAGVGLTSIGLALAAARDGGGGGAASSVIAADVCEHALATLRANAAANLGAPAPPDSASATDACFGGGGEAGGGGLRVLRWNAAGGRAAVARLRGAGVEVAQLTHVLGADIVSQPWGTARAALEDEADEAAGGGLEATLAALLDEKPALRVTLLLMDRCAGGAIGALSAAAGQPPGVAGAGRDPALVRFERRCERLGLRLERRRVPEEVMRRVSAAQPLHVRAQWWLADTTAGLWLYDVSRLDAPSQT